MSVRSHGPWRNVYFAAQRVRGGVHPDQIRQASAILDQSADELRSYVADRLVAIHGPEARDPEWLARQPLVDRATLRPVMKRIAEQGVAGLELRKTSGSTGVPFAFVKDKEMSAWMDAAMWATYAWHGITPGAPQARFWGMPPDPRRRAIRRVADFVQHRRRLDAFHSGPAHCVAFFQALRRFGATWAYGYPSLIAQFVIHCQEAGLHGSKLGVHVVICTGELLDEVTRQRISEFFECRVVNEYGCTESGVLAIGCEHDRLHQVPVAAMIEVVDSKGHPVAPGEVGEVVATDLHGSRGHPLLRYRLHDQAAAVPGECSCGRALPQLRVDTGRIDNFIITPARGRVYDALLAYTVPPAVSRFKARQTDTETLAVQIIVAKGADPEAVAGECRRRWETELGPGMHVNVSVVEDIPAEPSGKLRYFVPLERK